MTRLIDIEQPLADALRQIDEALEAGQEPPAELVKVAEQYSIEAVEKRDRCVAFLKTLDRFDEMDAEEIQRIRQLQTARARARKWLEDQIVLVMRAHDVKTLEGQRHRITLVQNPPHVEPTREPEEADVDCEWARRTVTISWIKAELKRNIEVTNGDPRVPAKLVPGEWRLKIT